MTRLLSPHAIRTVASDASLLGQFVRDRDEPAFAELVRRYGSLVLGVCRRVIPDRHLAEDAFQAAFVVLARKAESVRPADNLASWLYGVAFKVALRARTMSGRRAKRETLTGEVPETPVYQNTPDDSVAILDEAISALPALYREAVVLCELQGASRRDAAKQLGIQEGTLSSRLAKARKLLADNLSKRGLALPAVLTTSAILTPTLFAATVQSATGIAPRAVSALADGVTRIMLLSKLKLTVGLALVAVLSLGFGMGGFSNSVSLTAAPVPKEKQEGLIWIADHSAKKLLAFKPDGTVAKEIALPSHYLGLIPGVAKMAFVGMKGKLPLPDADGPLTLHIGEIDESDNGIDTGIPYSMNDGALWSPDGKQVIRIRIAANDPAKNGSTEFTHALIDVETKKEKELELPKYHRVTSWSPDGTWWLVTENEGDSSRLHRFPVNGDKPTKLSDDYRYYLTGAISPNGKSVAGFAAGKWSDGNETTAFAVPSTGGKSEIISKNPKALASNGTWSLDGKRIAFLTVEEPEDAPRNKLSVKKLTICDADGSNAKVLKEWTQSEVGDVDFNRTFTCNWLGK